jgi:hypothetical protein
MVPLVSVNGMGAARDADAQSRNLVYPRGVSDSKPPVLDGDGSDLRATRFNRPTVTRQLDRWRKVSNLAMFQHAAVTPAR